MTDSSAIERALRPVRRRLRLALMAIWLVRGLGLGGGLSVAVLVVSHLLDRRLGLATELMPIVLGGVVGLGIAVRRRPGLYRAARVVDGHFGLQDRVTCLLETSESPERLHAVGLRALQARDTMRHVRGLRLTESVRLTVRGREAAATGAAMVALIGVAALPWPPRTTARAAVSTPAARIRHVGQVTVPELERALVRGLPAGEQTDPTLSRVFMTLAHLRRQLSHAPSPAMALRSISLAQQDLAHEANGLRPLSPASRSQLSQALRRVHAGITDPTRAIERLAQEMRGATPAQRAALSRALMRAAARLQDRQLQSDLQNTADALAANDPHSAERSLKDIQNVLKRTPEEKDLQSRIRRVSTGLDRAKNDVSGLDQTHRRGSSVTPLGRRRISDAAGKHRSSASALPRSAQGTSPTTGKNAANGQVFANGHVVAPSFNRRGKTAGGGLKNQAGRHGKYANAKASVLEGKGLRTIELTGHGTPASQALRRYHPIVVRYAQAARSALDRAQLPPGLAAYVRKYFSVISQ